MRGWPTLLLAAGLAGAAAAGLPDLPLPEGASLAAETVADPGTLEVATAPWTAAGLPVGRVSGRIARNVWRIEAEGLTTAGLMAPIAAALGAAGYDTLLACETEGCGGFDFRFAIEVTDPPVMHVDLADFRYLSAAAPDGGGLVSVLVSRSALAGFVEVAHGVPAAARPAAEPRAAAEPADASPVADGDLAQSLDTVGHAILDGLAFETGSARLGAGGAPALAALAAWLGDNPDRRVALVGHTDAEGPLDGNVALSRARAEAVLARLVEEFDVPRRQLSAEGMGYLAPVASNLTDEGRQRNRRVEAVVLSIE